MLFRFLNKKFDLEIQRGIIGTYTITCVVWIILVDIIFSKQISFGQLLFQIIFDMFFISPLIYNILREERKLKVLKKLFNIHDFKDPIYPPFISFNEKLKVKAIYNYRNFIKGESYNICCLGPAVLNPYINSKKNVQHLAICDKYQNMTLLHKCINKFIIDDIREERKLKLKRIKKWL